VAAWIQTSGFGALRTDGKTLNKMTMRISWQRARAIFGNPEPPRDVWEKQFDYNDNDLRRLATTPWNDIKFDDLWYYYHDLAHVVLQPEVFRYLFPVCLMDWYRSLINNEACSHGDAEFHNGLAHGSVLERMVTDKQRQEINAFFRDGFLDRFDLEIDPPRFDTDHVPCIWLWRLNSIAMISPCIPMIWNSWWSLATLGQAIAAIKYCAGLALKDDENPFLATAIAKARSLGRQFDAGSIYFESDSMIYDVCWLPENIAFLRRVLVPDLLLERAKVAKERLIGTPHFELAARIVAQLISSSSLMELRINELTEILEQGSGRGETWSV
jgi:hypothetical protein